MVSKSYAKNSLFAPTFCCSSVLFGFLVLGPRKSRFLPTWNGGSERETGAFSRKLPHLGLFVWRHTSWTEEPTFALSLAFRRYSKLWLEKAIYNLKRPRNRDAKMEWGGPNLVDPNRKWTSKSSLASNLRSWQVWNCLEKKYLLKEPGWMMAGFKRAMSVAWLGSINLSKLDFFYRTALSQERSENANFGSNSDVSQTKFGSGSRRKMKLSVGLSWPFLKTSIVQDS